MCKGICYHGVIGRVQLGDTVTRFVHSVPFPTPLLFAMCNSFREESSLGGMNRSARNTRNHESKCSFSLWYASLWCKNNVVGSVAVAKLAFYEEGPSLHLIITREDELDKTGQDRTRQDQAEAVRTIPS